MAELIQYANGVPGIKWPVDKVALQIGRAAEINDIWLDDAFVSKKHAQIIVKCKPGTDNELEYYVQDLQSTNHTYVNNESVDEYQLNHNDILMIGKNKLVFLSEGVEEYVSAVDFREDNTEQMASEFAASGYAAPDSETSADEKSMDDMAIVSSASLSGKHRFSRRLTIY